MWKNIISSLDVLNLTFLCLAIFIYQCTKALPYLRCPSKAAHLTEDVRRFFYSCCVSSVWNSPQLIYFPLFNLFKASVSCICKAMSCCQNFSSLYFHHPTLLHFIFRYPELADKFGSTVLELWLTKAGERTMVRSRPLLLVNQFVFNGLSVLNELSYSFLTPE